MDISIVIPAFEEGKKIAADIEAASAFIASNRLTGEIIVVDDGSSDDTAETAEGVEVPMYLSKSNVAAATMEKVMRFVQA